VLGVLVGVVGLLAAGGVGWRLARDDASSRTTSTPGAQLADSGVEAPVPDAGAAGERAVDSDRQPPQGEPEEAVADAGAAVPPLDGGQKTVETPSGASAKRPSVSQPVTLNPETIAAVLGRNRAKILHCFEAGRAALSQNEGEIVLEMTIVSSGRVSAASVATPAYAGTPIAECILREVKRLRFPRHRDAELAISMPFRFRIAK